MAKAKAIATSNGKVDSATMEKFLTAKEHIDYKTNAAGAKIWYELDGAGIQDTRLTKATADEVLKINFGLTINEYVAAKEQWIEEEVAKSSAGAVEEDEAATETESANVEYLIDVDYLDDLDELVDEHESVIMTRAYIYGTQATFHHNTMQAALEYAKEKVAKGVTVEVGRYYFKEHRFEVIQTPEEETPKFEVGKTYYIGDYTLKVEARTEKMLTGTTVEGTRKYHIFDTFRGELVYVDIDGERENIWAAHEAKAAELNVEDYAVTVEAQNYAVLAEEHNAGNFSTDINGEYITFKNWSIVRIDAARKLKLMFNRTSTGAKKFYSVALKANGCHISAGSWRQISANTVANIYVARELAKEQAATFSNFFKGKYVPHRNIQLFFSLVYADKSAHDFTATFDRTDQKNEFLAEFKKVAGDTPCHVYVTYHNTTREWIIPEFKSEVGDNGNVDFDPALASKHRTNGNNPVEETKPTFEEQVAELQAKVDAGELHKIEIGCLYSKYAETLTAKFHNDIKPLPLEYLIEHRLPAVMIITKQNGKRVRIGRSALAKYFVSGNFSEFRIMKEGYSVLGTYDTPAQVETVINMLKAAIERDETEFTFPTVEELTTTPDNDTPDKLSDSLIRAITQGYVKAQECLKVNDIKGALNELALIKIANDAHHELLKEAC